jgi:hypothetical protein
MQLLSTSPIGPNVRIVKQPDISAIKNVPIAKVPATYSWACGIQQWFKGVTFKRINLPACNLQTFNSFLRRWDTTEG